MRLPDQPQLCSLWPVRRTEEAAGVDTAGVVERRNGPGWGGWDGVVLNDNRFASTWRGWAEVSEEDLHRHFVANKRIVPRLIGLVRECVINLAVKFRQKNRIFAEQRTAFRGWRFRWSGSSLNGNWDAWFAADRGRGRQREIRGIGCRFQRLFRARRNGRLIIQWVRLNWRRIRLSRGDGGRRRGLLRNEGWCRSRCFLWFWRVGCFCG